MPHRSALPFFLSRSSDVIGMEMTSTREKVDGLLHLGDDDLSIQWRVARTTDRIGSEIRTDREFDPVLEVVVPLDEIAGARVKRLWWSRLRGFRLTLTATTLTAFEAVAGESELRLRHPAELVVRVRARDGEAAEEFVSELVLALAERALAAAEEADALSAGRTGARNILDPGTPEPDPGDQREW